MAPRKSNSKKKSGAGPASRRRVTHKRGRGKKPAASRVRGRFARWVAVAVVLLIIASVLAVRLDPDRSGSWITEGLDAITERAETMLPARAETWPPRLSGRSVEDWAEAQIALTRLGLSPGAINGRETVPSRQALTAFQQLYGLPRTGLLDSATREKFKISEPLFIQYTVTADDLASVAPPAPTYRQRSQQASLGYADILEALAERAHSEREFLREINPGLDWSALAVGTVVRLPAVDRVEMPLELRYLNVQLEAKTLQAYSEDGRLLFHFPVSIGGDPESRLQGSYFVENAVSDPNYTLRPERFPEAARREGIEQPIVLPPGPNNPVGTVWIGLDRPSYGIHGTPNPERIGQTDSLGCFRLTNWDAESLLPHVYPGLPVYVE